MSRKSRGIFESGTFHIMIQGINKSYIFNTKELKKVYINLMKKYKVQYNISIVAYCIMDNHAHFIINTEDIKEISKFMHNVNTAYSKVYNEKLQRVGYVFRNRFNSHNIYSYSYLINCIKYIHMNPVNAGIVKSESDYEFSSYKEYFCKNNQDEKVVSHFLKQEDIDILKNIKYKEIEIMDIERSEEENIKVAIKDFLDNKRYRFCEIKKNKELCYELIRVLKEKGYKQKCIAGKLEISEKKISRILKDK